MGQSRRKRDQILLGVGVFLLAQGCSGGGGCGCTQPLPNGFPANERHSNSIQARVSDTGIAFLEANASGLVGALVPGGLTIDVPSSCGGNPEVCCGEPPGTCLVEIDMDPQPGDPPRMELTPRDPPGNQLGVVLRARVRTVNPMPIVYDTGLFSVDCDVEIDTTWSGAESLTVTTNIDFTQDPAVGTTRIASGAADVTDLDTGDVSLSGGFTCAIADLFLGVFIGQLESQIETVIQDTVNEQVCKACEVDPNCAPFATCDGNNVCQVDEGGAGQRCLQELGMTGRMYAKDLLASLSPGQQGAMDIYDVLGGYARTNNNGLSLGLLGGGISADGVHNPCAGVDSPPTPLAIGESNFFQVNTRQDTGEAFDVGIGLHEFFLNQNAYAAFDSGVLCMNVGTRTVDLLNSDTFSILVPSLVDLLHGDTAQLVLGLRPQRRPVLTLGAGTFTVNSSGEKVIDEPLITILLPQLQIDFFAMVDERFVRVFTLQTDLTIPIGLDVDEMGQIVPILGDLGDGFQNITVTNSELLSEEPADIADKFPSILSIAVPFLASALGGFALPEIAGLAIRVAPGGITSVESNTFLAIFGTLAVAGPKPRPRVDTWAEITGLTVPPTAAFRAARLDRTKTPMIELALGGLASDGTDRGLEWQYRFDGGLWSPYTSSRAVRLTREGFWLQGRHVIEVRAREVGLADTTDLEPARLDFVIDTIGPEVTLSSTAGGVAVDARDLVTAAEDLQVAYRVDGGTWTAVTGSPAVLPLSNEDLLAAEIRVTDESGNATFASSEMVYFHGRAPAGEGCSCRAGSSRGGGGGLVAGLLVVLAVVGLRARGGRRLPFVCALFVALVAAAAACGGKGGGDIDAGGPNPNEVQHGPIGRWSDIAAADGRVVISAYEEKLGDLVIGEVNTETGNPFWTALDGIPDGPVVLDPNLYRDGINAAGEDVGAWTSIALRDGFAFIAYQDRDRGALKYAAEDGDWPRHVVDSGMGGEAGRYTSLSIDASGVPGIAYMALGVDDGANGKRAELRWAQATSASPRSETDWVVTVVAQVHVPCTNLCGEGNVCVAASETCAPLDSSCASCADGTACVSGACVDVLVDSAAVDLPEGTGLFASAGRLSDDRPVIAYYDRSVGDLMMAVRDAGGAWTVVPLDAASETDTGQWASLAVAADDTIHVAYQDALGDRLLHVSWNNGATGPVEVIDSGDRSPDRPHSVGASAALVIDAQGNLIVAYQDQATSDLLTASNNGGAWAHSDLATGEDGYGFFTSADVDGGTIWISTYLYSRTVYPLGELDVLSIP